MRTLKSLIMPLLVLAAVIFGASSALSQGWDTGGSVGLEARLFTEDPAFDGQEDGPQSSIIFEGELRWRSGDRRHQLVLVPRLRLDAVDDERSHADLREGFYRHVGDAFTLEAGLIKVFWGTTESRHLVDIINQTDSVEDSDGEDKLGQPAIRLTRQTDWGRLEAYILPGFRERTFPGREGRLRAPLVVDTDAPIYENDDEERHVDLAARWSHYIGDWDIGLAAFHGTSREPGFVPSADGQTLRPLYAIISQVSADIQLTRGAWLWKGEAIVREGQGDTFAAFTGGLEYTFYGVTASGADFGVLAEYHSDGRDSDPAVAPPTAFDNDVFLGGRLAFNDMRDTSVLGGAVIDVENGSSAVLIEAERRFGSHIVVEVEGRFTVNIDPADALASVRRDDAVTLRVTRHF
ncbi:hypothetical protein [Maricaulis sp.]|uniref:hypothetical protein n=1 Tax=Maricaulis sp. TaxID=1486257 RepID=UPI0025C68764|nr:hypothetical protein [Maricaulis sp.]